MKNPEAAKVGDWVQLLSPMLHGALKVGEIAWRRGHEHRKISSCREGT